MTYQCSDEICQALLNEAQYKLDGAYRERAHLVALLASQYPSQIVDHEEWPIIYITSPMGQVSWHISKSDMDLFSEVPMVRIGEIPRGDAVWDRHDSAQKYRRIQNLTQSNWLEK